jgi:glutamine---fructose-6-phosphate transaminase (isomerizing)
LTSLMFEEARSAPACIASLLADDASVRELVASLRATPPRATVTIARGTSDHAASYFAYLMMARYGQLVTSLPMSLFTLYRAPFAAAGMLALAISQSGRSPDLVEPIQMLRANGATTVAMVNEPGSALAAAAQWELPLLSGPEISVAATKSSIASLVAGARLAALWHGDEELLRGLRALPDQLESASQQDWSSAIPVFKDAERIMVIGRGTGMPTALESALKFKETSTIQAEAFSAAEVKHGPMALVGDGYPMLVFAPRGPAQQSLLSLASEMRGRGAKVVLVAPPDVAERDLTMTVASTPDLDPILALQSFYLMVEGVSRARGLDPDTPRHLNKVTTTR